MPHKLITNWRKCKTRRGEFVYPNDARELKDNKKIERVTYKGFKKFSASPHFCMRDDKALHLGLIPIPFAGNIERAKIFLLMLNPGISISDYFAEENHDYKTALLKNLRQRTSKAFPNIFFDPQFSWTPGFTYWQKKFDGVAQKLIKAGKCKNYRQALQLLSKNIACLELVPYRSKNFGADEATKLLSCIDMIDFVKNIVAPRAKKGEALILVMRGIKHWGLKKSRNIVVYSAQQTRAAHLSSKVEIKIMNFLKL